MPTIHALLIGINAYPSHPLSGCINDVKAVEAYLKKMYDAQSTFHLRVNRITDEEAIKPARENIIKGFSFFNEAKDGDVCLFYYSGHGSFSKAPEEFWTERDGYLESFVCIDSRLQGGRDLMNKEVGFLISKALENKPGVQFIAITDCCHSGTITKALRENKWKERSFVADFTPKSIESYLGFGETVNGQPAYRIDAAQGKRKVTVQQGKHIHLAASQENQTAKELMIDGVQHGAFTYSLLKTLYNNRGLISYQKLVSSATIQVNNLVRAQNPVLNLNGGLNEGEGKKYFLLTDVDTTIPLYKVYWDHKAGWCIAAGVIHGASVGDVVVIEGVCETKIIDQYAADFSVLLSKPQLGAKDKEYGAKLYVEPAQKVKVSFATDLKSDAKERLQGAYQKLHPDYVEITGDLQPQYYIRNNDQGVYIALPGSDVPVFDYVVINSDAEAVSFLEKIASVANWLHLLEVNNPATTLSDKDYEISIKRCVEGGSYDPASFEVVNDITRPVDLYYQLKEGKWYQPAIQLTLTNKSEVDLWFSCLYMGFDYSISGSSLKEVRLPAGMTTVLTMIEKGVEKDVLKLMVDPKLLKKGYNEITEYLKLFISTYRINTSKFSQDGLDLAPVAKDLFRAARTKGLGSEEETLSNDWKTETIGLHIVRPKEATQIEDGKAINVHGVIIEAPASFSARVSLSSSSQVANAKSLAPHQAIRNAALQPFPLLPEARSGSVIDMLELLDVSHAEQVTAKEPLIVRLPSARDAAATSVIPLGVDPETGLYFPVGYVDEQNNIRIELLPEQTPSTSVVNAKSLVGSIKIYFQKVVSDWFGTRNPYPRLAMPVFESGELKYVSDQNILKEKIKTANTILLMIHGIIGDTKGMAQSLKAVLDDQGTTMEKTVDLSLTFDYENLKTSIAETAVQLKEALMNIGLQEGHGKKLVIVAHSMGGLVSRWFIEKEGGDKIVSHLVMYGTPNNGTPWADVRDMAQAIITYGVNGAAFLQPWLFVLSGVGKLVDGTQVTFKEMDAQTGIYPTLNKGDDPGIGYTIVSGNTQDIMPDYVKTASLISRIFSRAKHSSYKLLDTVLFKKPNDIAVSVESIEGIPGSEKWKIKPVKHTVACDHLNYFSTKEALKYLQSKDYGR